MNAHAHTASLPVVTELEMFSARNSPVMMYARFYLIFVAITLTNRTAESKEA